MVLRPPSIAALTKSISRMLKFPENRTLNTLFDRSGKLVTSINEIQPGTTIWASSYPADEQLHPITTARAASPDRARAAARSGPRMGGGQSGRESRLIIVNDTVNLVPFHARRRHDWSDSDDLPVDEDAERLENTGISHRALERLFGFLPFSLTGEDLAKLCTPIVGRFCSRVEKCEEVQQTVIWQYVQHLFPPLPEVSGSVRHVANSLVDKGTFCNSFGAFTRMQHLIVGPPRSGKTTFLQVIANALLARQFASGQFKKTMVVFIDMRSLVAAFSDPMLLYRELVGITFKHLTAQKLTVLPYAKSLISYFTNLPTFDRLVALPQAFVLDEEFRCAVPLLSQIAQGLFDSIGPHNQLGTWLCRVVAFPRAVAGAFGFGNVQFIVDHLDVCDVDCQPTAPFESNDASASLIEYFKAMLSSDSFIASCVNEDQILGAPTSVLEGATDDGVDLTSGTEIVPVFDLDPDHNDRYFFRLVIGDDQATFCLCMKHCGGCSGYLHLWDRLMQLGDRVRNEDKKDSSSKIARELRLTLLQKLREVAGLLFYRFDEKDQTVTQDQTKISAFEVLDTEVEIEMDD